MKLLVAPDSTFYKTPDGKYWSKTVYSYSFFERYLTVFEKIIVASRVESVSSDSVSKFMRADGPNMEVAELPSLRGIKAYALNFTKIKKAADKLIKDSDFDCALVRLPSIPASFVLASLKKTNKPVALEIVCDPEDAYASNKIAQKFFTNHLKKAALQANGVSYVTRDFLQSKYPSYARIHGESKEHFESYFSTIQLADDYYTEPRKYVSGKRVHIIHTANNMNNDVKGHKVLIDAFKLLIDKGYDIDLTFVGDGTKKTEFETYEQSLGLDDKVRFTGRLIGGNLVRAELLKADMLVFPTKAEGLPRTIIEAMAVGLPCISTPIAGIPELLEPEDMLDPMDVGGFARRIEDFINNPAMMEEKSRRNIEVALRYRNDVLTERRNGFYKKLKNLVSAEVRK